jgi:YecR-like lipoprotein
MKKILFLTCASVLASCTVQRDAIPIGGSRADGTVELAYEFPDMANPQVDWNKAQLQAEQRCQAWGYTAAERFGGERRQCNAPSGYGCMNWQVTVPYQCTGGKPVAQNQ